MKTKHLSSQDQNIIIDNLSDILNDRFGRYAKAIIQDRALPDIRDGLKPVQRRIIYAMYDLGLKATSTYKKSVRVVGETIGKYHPHGDSSVYEAIVRLSQPWKMSVPLVQMHGNNGSIDGDNAAAMRYTEIRLTPFAELLTNNLLREIIPFQANFDNSEQEPTILPASFCNFLVNGATGIAVGMATNAPPHNFNETIAACIFRLKYPTCSLSELMQIFKGPDFPTGGIISNAQDLAQAYLTGKGRVVLESCYHLESTPTITNFVITQIPYEINKQDLITKINHLVVQEKLDVVRDIRDETDRNGIRIVLELDKAADTDAIIAFLKKKTQLRIFYNINLVGIVNGKPQQMPLLTVIDEYLASQWAFFMKKATYELALAQKKLEIILGLIMAVQHLDVVIALIRKATSKAEAMTALMERFNLNQAQTEAIVNLRLYRLSSTDVKQLTRDQLQLQATIKHLQQLVTDKAVMTAEIIAFYTTITNQYLIPRKTSITNTTEAIVDLTALIKKEPRMLSLSYDGWIKTMTLKTTGELDTLARKPGDLILSLQPVMTTDKILILTNHGTAIPLLIHNIKTENWKNMGDNINNLAKLKTTEKIINAIIYDEKPIAKTIMIITKKGYCKKMNLTDFIPTTQRPFSYIKLKSDDTVVDIALCTSNDDMIVVTKTGFYNKYSVTAIAPLLKQAQGIKAIKLEPADEVCGFAVGKLSENLVLILKSSIKNTPISTIKTTARAVKGYKLLNQKKGETLNILNAFGATKNDVLHLLQKDNKISTVSLKTIPESLPLLAGKKIGAEIILAKNNKLLLVNH